MAVLTVIKGIVMIRHYLNFRRLAAVCLSGIALVFASCQQRQQPPAGTASNGQPSSANPEAPGRALPESATTLRSDAAPSDPAVATSDPFAAEPSASKSS